MDRRDWLPLLFVAGSLGLCIWGLTLPSDVSRFGTEIRRMKSPAPALAALALTFNGGPEADQLASLLGLLSARGVQATFFVRLDEPLHVLLPLIASRHELGLWFGEPGSLTGTGHHLTAVRRAQTRLAELGYTGEVPVRNAAGGTGFSLALLKLGVPNVLWSREEGPGAIIALRGAEPDLTVQTVEFLNRQSRRGLTVLSFSGLRKLHQNL